jgi:hypothetical protein
LPGTGERTSRRLRLVTFWFVLIGIVVVVIAFVAAWAMGRREEAELDRLGIDDGAPPERRGNRFGNADQR